MNIRTTTIVRVAFLASLVFTTGLVHGQSGYSGGKASSVGSAVKKVILEQRFGLSQSMSVEEVRSAFSTPVEEYSGNLSFILDDDTLAPFSTLNFFGMGFSSQDFGMIRSFELSTDLIRPSKLDGTVDELFDEIKSSINDVFGKPYSESVEDFRGTWVLGSSNGSQTDIIAGWSKGGYLDCLLKYDRTGEDSGYITLLLAMPQ